MKKLANTIILSIALLKNCDSSLLDDILTSNGLRSKTSPSYADTNSFSQFDPYGSDPLFYQQLDFYNRFEGQTTGLRYVPDSLITSSAPTTSTRPSIVDNILKRANTITTAPAATLADTVKTQGPSLVDGILQRANTVPTSSSFTPPPSTKSVAVSDQSTSSLIDSILKRANNVPSSPSPSTPTSTSTSTSTPTPISIPISTSPSSLISSSAPDSSTSSIVDSILKRANTVPSSPSPSPSTSTPVSTSPSSSISSSGSDSSRSSMVDSILKRANSVPTTTSSSSSPAITPSISQIPDSSTSSIINSILQRANTVPTTSSSSPSSSSSSPATTSSVSQIPDSSRSSLINSILQRANTVPTSPSTSTSTSSIDSLSSKIGDNGINLQPVQMNPFASPLNQPESTGKDFANTVLQQALDQTKNSDSKTKTNLRTDQTNKVSETFNSGSNQQNTGTVADSGPDLLSQVLNPGSSKVSQDPLPDISTQQPPKNDFVNSVLQSATNQARPSIIEAPSSSVIDASQKIGGR